MPYDFFFNFLFLFFYLIFFFFCYLGRTEPGFIDGVHSPTIRFDRVGPLVSPNGHVVTARDEAVLFVVVVDVLQIRLHYFIYSIYIIKIIIH